MTNSKKRQYAVGTLVVAIAAFAVDRLWLSPGQDPPSTVATASAAPARTAAVSKATVTPTPTPATKLETVLAGRLKALATRQGLGEGVRDAFQPSLQWVPAKETAKVKAAQVEAPAPELDAVQAFTGRYKLSAVLIGSSDGAAVVSNTLMRVGQSLDGFRLAQIRRTSVVFAAPDGRNVTLFLEGANLESSGN